MSHADGAVRPAATAKPLPPTPPPKPSAEVKISRLLAAVDGGSATAGQMPIEAKPIEAKTGDAKTDGKAAGKTPPLKMVSGTVFAMNITPVILKAYQPTSLLLPDTLMFCIDLEMAEEGFSKLTADPSFQAFLHERTKERVGASIDAIIKQVKLSDAALGANLSTRRRGQKTTPVTADEARAGLVDEIQRAQEEISKDLVEVVEKSIEVFIGDKQRLKAYRIKAFAKVVTGVIVIGGSVAITAVTWGATSPAAVVGIARSTAAIVQTVATLAASASSYAKLIELDFKVLDSVITKLKNDQSDKARKLKNDAKEVGLAAIASLTGIQTPSVKTCGERIDTYRTKITELEVESKKLGPKIYELIDSNTALSDEIEAMQPGPERAKLEKLFAKSGPTLTKLLDHVADLNVGIQTGHNQDREFRERFEKFEKARHKWTEWAGTVFDFAIDLGLGLTSSAEALDKGLATIISVETALMNVAIDKVG
jgi:hypothetical protein